MVLKIYRSVMATLVLLVLVSGVYPLLVYGLGQLLFPGKANGGIIHRDGKPIGAELIGQGFSKPEYFHGRPSSAGDKGYDASNSSGSNLGPTNPKLYDAVRANVDGFLKDNPTIQKGQVPVELVTASGSGLDPDITPEGALAQVDRVAKARNAGVDKIRELVQERTRGPDLGIFGEPTVNVLRLNLELDERFPVLVVEQK